VIARRPRLTRALIAAAVLLLCGAAAIACKSGGGGKATAVPTTAGAALTAQEYFARISELNDEASLGLVAVNNGLATALPTDRGLEALRASITQYAEIYEAFRDGMLQLSPPEDLQETHQAAIAALAAFLGYSEDAAAEAEEAQDILDIAAIIDNEEARTVNGNLTDACEALQQAAASEDVEMDLACGEQ